HPPWQGGALPLSYARVAKRVRAFYMQTPHGQGKSSMNSDNLPQPSENAMFRSEIPMQEIGKARR
ncbi:hypothetical protein OKA04_21550, partial [Luteolibacter flavescens]